MAANYLEKIYRRKLGSSDFEVAPLALGGNVFGWTIDPAMSYRILDAFVDGGGNLIDTADVYSAWVPGNKGGESEKILGQWLKRSGKRSQVVIATKVGMEVFGEQGLSRKHILSSVEVSLTRLQTDYIDLYQSHKDDADTPLEETLEAFNDLIQQGKVRIVGASNYSADRFRKALAVSRREGWASYQTLQPQFNLMDRKIFESELQKVCVDQSIGVIPYSSLASGFLTGKYRKSEDLKKGARGGRVEGYMNERGLRVLQALDKVSQDLEVPQAQVALAWLKTKPSIVAPIASATKVEQLAELLGSMTLDLDPVSIRQLDQASAES